MRNGNTFTLSNSKRLRLSSYPTYEEWKQRRALIQGLFEYSSYPTYEEWKQNINFFLFYRIYFGSYPTYEEWKPPICSTISSKTWSSYPTYEEWKQRYRGKLLGLLDFLFLSYLWGMETLFPFLRKSLPPSVLILPMRNGNLYLSLRPWYGLFRSYPTYEEWKPSSLS